MRKSARVLGQDYGLTAQEMNHVLKEEGYLEGESGNYSVTEKGEKYVSEQDHSRGTGGYSFYNPSWTTRTWDEEITDELDITEDRKKEIRKEMKESRQKVNEPEDESIEFDYGYEDADTDTNTTDDTSGGFFLVLAILLAGCGIKKAAPYAKRFWDDSAKPFLNEDKNKVVGKAKKSRRRK